MSFVIGQGHVITGLEQGIQGMEEGQARRLILPPQFAYGSHGLSPFIPPNATLEFEVSLVCTEAHIRGL